MKEKLYRALVLAGLVVIIILLLFRGSCGCGTDPWAFFDGVPQLGEVLENDAPAP